MCTTRPFPPSGLHEKGIPTNIIQRLIGHSSPDITFLEYDSSEALSYARFAEEMDIGGRGAGPEET